MINKLDSLKNLHSWGFNVMDFMEYQKDTEQELRECFRSKRVGVRTSIINPTAQVSSLPFFRNVSVEWALKLARKLVKNYQVIIYEWCPKEYSVLSGHVVLHGNYGSYEVFRGKGVVRDLVEDSELKVERGGKGIGKR
jgi:hypothetical protein